MSEVVIKFDLGDFVVFFISDEAMVITNLVFAIYRQWFNKESLDKEGKFQILIFVNDEILPSPNQCHCPFL
ncbi:hypothetical protein LPTSP3_g20810 [Leptospira kobayashii]|uniref:Uncharacterized protein n=1 Tax=Leptospira kobayashii TaxID=1917830 RepID=A0ABN6KGX9_9LEPT|nr:hypothetical protein LPTSP3_g20810 [Leptospira kobayashii]